MSDNLALCEIRLFEFLSANSQPVDEIGLQDDRRGARASQHSRRGRDVSPEVAPLELGNLSILSASGS